MQNCGKSGLGHWASGLPGCGGLWAFERWAMDLLLAKPSLLLLFVVISFFPCPGHSKKGNQTTPYIPC